MLNQTHRKHTCSVEVDVRSLWRIPKHGSLLKIEILGNFSGYPLDTLSVDFNGKRFREKFSTESFHRKFFQKAIFRPVALRRYVVIEMVMTTAY